MMTWFELVLPRVCRQLYKVSTSIYKRYCQQLGLMPEP